MKPKAALARPSAGGWHVDLVTAHKPHFEIVETLLRYQGTAKLS